MANLPDLPALASPLITSALPALPCTDAYYRLPPDSGSNGKASTTMRQHIAKALVPLNPSNMFLRVLDDPDLKAVLARQFPPMAVESTHSIEGESDVEWAAYLYFIHGINLILAAYLEAKEAGTGKQLACRSQVTKEASRVDILWSIGNDAIMCVEVKRPGVLKDSDWDPAIGKGENQHKQHDEALKIAKAVHTAAKATAFMPDTNAERLLKQVTKYAKQYQIPMVILFDWKRMIVLDLPNAGNEHHENAADMPAYFFTDETVVDSNNNPWTHRRVLLAVLLVALERKGAR
ncbi:hypothetical protein C8R43DRAFT_1139192 [Mycena crocata]|nr:hypothetical protein C8R43DRAFT_1139192 [Mycena crocata]